MKTTLSKSLFVDMLKAVRRDAFSGEALEALFDYYEEVEQDTGVELEFDPIAICCEWEEQDGEQLISDYQIDMDEWDSVQDFLEHHTTVIALSEDTFLFMTF